MTTFDKRDAERFTAACSSISRRDCCPRKSVTPCEIFEFALSRGDNDRCSLAAATMQNCPNKPRSAQTRRSPRRPSPTFRQSRSLPRRDGRQTASQLAAPNLSVNAFAKGLEHPRWLFVLPNGDVLVAESNAPQRPEEGKGIKGWVYKTVQKWAGAGVPSAGSDNSICATRMATALPRRVPSFLKNLHSPFGMALIGNDLYVANADAILRFKYQEGATEIAGNGEKVVGSARWTNQPSLD